MTSPYYFSDRINKDLKEIYENGSVQYKQRLRKSPGIQHMLNATHELVQIGNKLVESRGFRSFYKRYFLKSEKQNKR